MSSIIRNFFGSESDLEKEIRELESNIDNTKNSLTQATGKNTTDPNQLFLIKQLKNKLKNYEYELQALKSAQGNRLGYGPGVGVGFDQNAQGNGLGYGQQAQGFDQNAQGNGLGYGQQAQGYDPYAQGNGYDPYAQGNAQGNGYDPFPQGNGPGYGGQRKRRTKSAGQRKRRRTKKVGKKRKSRK